MRIRIILCIHEKEGRSPGDAARYGCVVGDEGHQTLRRSQDVRKESCASAAGAFSKRRAWGAMKGVRGWLTEMLRLELEADIAKVTGLLPQPVDANITERQLGVVYLQRLQLIVISEELHLVCFRKLLEDLAVQRFDECEVVRRGPLSGRKRVWDGACGGSRFKSSSCLQALVRRCTAKWAGRKALCADGLEGAQPAEGVLTRCTRYSWPAHGLTQQPEA